MRIAQDDHLRGKKTARYPVFPVESGGDVPVERRCVD
jgi:hypothetical protein